MSLTPAIRIQKLSKRYNNSTLALDNVDLTIQPGEFFGLLGPNGAGKTTMLSILTSLTRKSSGKVWVHGHDIDVAFSKARQYMGIVPQEFNFMAMDKVIDIVLYQAGYYGIAPKQAYNRAESLLKTLSLWEKRHSIARSLSGGMKRRLMIARAMVCQPAILILDEPTAGVDVEIRHTMWQYLRELNAAGTTIILTSHYLEEIEQLCKRVAIIKQGKLIRDTQVAALLAELPCETFILDTQDQISVEQLQLDGLHFEVINPHQLKVSISDQQSLNQIFIALQQQGITVHSMRSQSNRLETLFLHLTQD